MKPLTRNFPWFGPFCLISSFLEATYFWGNSSQRGAEDIPSDCCVVPLPVPDCNGGALAHYSLFAVGAMISV